MSEATDRQVALEPTMTCWESRVDAFWMWQCDCGWSHKLARREQIENPRALDPARLAASGHMKEAHGA